MPGHLQIVAVGRLDPFWRPVFEHYRRLIAARVELHVREVRETSIRGRSRSEVLRLESEQLLAAVRHERCVVVLDEHGRMYDSVGLAKQLRVWQESGGPAFVIGGSLGVSAAVRERAHEVLSLSRLTLPHQLARIVLAEQLFRALKIVAGETYHH